LFRSRPTEWEDVYLRGAQNLRTGGALYGPTEPYTYPPFMAWASIPFTALPRMPARIAWYLVSFACLVAMACWAWKLVRTETAGSLTAQDPWSRTSVCAIGLFLG